MLKQVYKTYSLGGGGEVPLGKYIDSIHLSFLLQISHLRNTDVHFVMAEGVWESICFVYLFKLWQLLMAPERNPSIL